MNEMLMYNVVQDMKRRSARQRSKPARLSDPVTSTPNRRLTSAPKKARKSAAVEKATRCSKKSMTCKAWLAHKEKQRDDKNARRRGKRAAEKEEKGAKATGRASTQKKSKASAASARKKSKASTASARKKSKASTEEEEDEALGSDQLIAKLSNLVYPEEASRYVGDIERPLRVLEACAPSLGGRPSFIVRTVRLLELIKLCHEGRLVNARPIQ